MNINDSRRISPSYSSTNTQTNPSCGNKHDTLVKISDFLEEEPSENVVLPKPLGIPSEHVTLFLRKSAPQFFLCWEQLKEIYGEEHPNFFDDPRVMPLIAEAQESIKVAFKQFELPLEMQRWLKSDQYYMVRSTGSEDSAKSANAGGNISCNYIRQEEIPVKLGEVIASYIGKRSLANRIRSGENPFATLPELSVTLQLMIGETINGESNPHKIPISCVCFTTEPLYGSFRFMKLSASYGHGEGVVGNCGVLTDTIFILQSISRPDKLYIWYENQEKNERLCPVQTEEGVKLELVVNPEELVGRRVFSSGMIKQLFDLGLKLENFFCASNRY